MKQVSHKIMSFVMAIVVLCSTMSFTLNMHYCGDTLVETVLFHKAKGCGMKMEKPLAEGCAITKKDCCKNEQSVVDGQDELQLSLEKVTLEQQLFIASFVYTYINIIEDLEEKTPSYKTYKPPLVRKQLFKLDETYLI